MGFTSEAEDTALFGIRNLSEQNLAFVAWMLL